MKDAKPHAKKTSHAGGLAHTSSHPVSTGVISNHGHATSADDPRSSFFKRDGNLTMLAPRLLKKISSEELFRRTAGFYANADLSTIPPAISKDCADACGVASLQGYLRFTS